MLSAIRTDDKEIDECNLGDESAQRRTTHRAEQSNIWQRARCPSMPEGCGTHTHTNKRARARTVNRPQLVYNNQRNSSFRPYGSEIFPFPLDAICPCLGYGISNILHGIHMSSARKQTTGLCVCVCVCFVCLGFFFACSPRTIVAVFVLFHGNLITIMCVC